MFDPRHLQLLQEIARTGSLSAAARELGFSQPAVSYQLRTLERMVGAVLVVRNGRSASLTPAGEVLAGHADRILSSIQTAEQELADIVGTQAGRVRVAAFPSSCATIVASAMATMRRRRPAVEVLLSQAEPQRAETMVRRGEVDLAVSYRYEGIERRPEPPGGGRTPLQRITLLHDPVRVVLAADHPLAQQPEVKLAELADATWLTSSQTFEAILQRAAAGLGFTPETTTVYDDHVSMQSLVAHGLGVAVLPRLALHAHLDDRVVCRIVRDWPARLVEAELWPDRMRVDAVSAMLKTLRAACRRYTEPETSPGGPPG